MAATATAWAVVVAAGTGTRFGGYKQFAALGGREVLDWSLEAACRHCAGTVLVLPYSMVPSYRGRAQLVVAGGETRTASVAAGLRAVPEEAEVVVVHDAARPLAGEALWHQVISAVLEGADAAVPCLPVTDTIKQRGTDGRLATLDRSLLVAAQTPQAFSAGALRAAHAAAAIAGKQATDDAALIEAMGGAVVSVNGEKSNLKLTDKVDLAVAEALLGAR